MQSMKNATKQLNTPTWHRQRADKLLAAACRSSEIGGGAHKLTAARRSRRRAHYAHYSQPEEWSPPFVQLLAKAQPFFYIPFIYVAPVTPSVAIHCTERDGLVFSRGLLSTQSQNSSRMDFHNILPS